MKYSNCCFDISIVDDARARQQLYRASKDIEYWYRPEINSISQMHHIRQFSQHTFFDHSNRSNLTQFSVCHLLFRQFRRTPVAMETSRTTMLDHTACK